MNGCERTLGSDKSSPTRCSRPNKAEPDYSLIITVVPTVLSITNAIILAYNLKLNRDSTQLRQWVDTLQHSNLLIKLEGETELQISVTNVGDIPIDKVEIKVEGAITKGTSHFVFTKDYKSKTMILQKATSTIPLYRTLEPVLLAQKLIGNHYEEQSTGDRDEYGEMILYDQKYTHILDTFTIDFSIKVGYNIHGAAKVIPKEFKVHYNYIEEFGDHRYGDSECRYCDNFRITIEELQWTS